MPTRRTFIRTGLSAALGAALLPLVDARADVDPIPPSIDPDLAGNVTSSRKPSLTESERILLPLERNAYYCKEEVEIAVTDLLAGQKAVVSLVPEKPGLTNVDFTVIGDGGTVNSVLAPYTLAPAGYKILIDGKDTGLSITISSGVNISTMLISRSGGIKEVQEAGGNFVVGNAFGFGRLDPDGMPARRPRGMRSAGCQAFENAIAADLPTMVCAYWTGYTTHKPWGVDKSWAAKDMVEMMRMFNFHTGQRLRRYRENIISVGGIDEPGLAWGRTPAGTEVSGFPNWDEKEWYEDRGWKFTDNPAARDDEDWLKYVKIRCDILGQNMRWAREDLKSVWPECVFSSDLYATHAMMDGCDPMNQTANDVPNTHVFLDWGAGRAGVFGAMRLEKAHDPDAKLAMRTNGQLVGPACGRLQQIYSYRVTLNGMLAAGLASNWWLNSQDIENADLKTINEPALRMGPLFLEMAPANHDVAILWSTTELAMREKAVAAREAAGMRDTALRDANGHVRIPVDAYTLGLDHTDNVLLAHNALARAGYPAHFLHEARVSAAELAKFKAVVVVGQTRDLPAEVLADTSKFAAAGGRVFLDESCKVTIPGSIGLGVGFTGVYDRYAIPMRDPGPYANMHEQSSSWTNYFMDEPARKLAPGLRDLTRAAGIDPVIETDSTDLVADRHAAGEGALIMVLNVHEDPPAPTPTEWCPTYNYAPQTASYALRGVNAGAAVYLIEGPDWTSVSRVEKPLDRQTKAFDPGEMKLYLVAPRHPGEIVASASIAQPGLLKITAALPGLAMPWPIVVTVIDRGTQATYRFYRALNAKGEYSEEIGVGANSAGPYEVDVRNPIDEFIASVVCPAEPQPALVARADPRVRVIDEGAIRDFLRKKTQFAVLDGMGVPPLATEVAGKLQAAGIAARVVPEDGAIRKARYPRMWDPYVTVYTPGTPAVKPPAAPAVKVVSLETAQDGRTLAKTADGLDLGSGWMQAGVLAHVTGRGYFDAAHQKIYEPGCELGVPRSGQCSVLSGVGTATASTDDLRQAWSGPWQTLQRYDGGDELPPGLPEAYAADEAIILVGARPSSTAAAGLYGSDVPDYVVDVRWPGPGKAVLGVVRSPFCAHTDVLWVQAWDSAGARLAADRLDAIAHQLSLAP